MSQENDIIIQLRKKFSYFNEIFINEQEILIFEKQRIKIITFLLGSGCKYEIDKLKMINCSPAFLQRFFYEKITMLIHVAQCFFAQFFSEKSYSDLQFFFLKVDPEQLLLPNIAQRLFCRFFSKKVLTRDAGLLFAEFDSKKRSNRVSSLLGSSFKVSGNPSSTLSASEYVYLKALWLLGFLIKVGRTVHLSASQLLANSSTINYYLQSLLVTQSRFVSIPEYLRP